KKEDMQKELERQQEWRDFYYDVLNVYVRAIVFMDDDLKLALDKTSHDAFTASDGLRKWLLERRHGKHDDLFFSELHHYLEALEEKHTEFHISVARCILQQLERNRESRKQFIQRQEQQAGKLRQWLRWFSRTKAKNA